MSPVSSVFHTMVTVSIGLKKGFCPHLDSVTYMSPVSPVFNTELTVKLDGEHRLRRASGHVH